MAFCGAFGLLPAGVDWAVSACVTVVCALAAAKLGEKMVVDGSNTLALSRER